MKKFWLTSLITLALLCTTTLVAESTNDDSPVDNKSTYHITDTIDMVTKTDTQYEKPRVIIRLVYPGMAGSEDSQLPADDNPDTISSTAGNSKIDTFNQAVTAIIKQEIEDYKQKVAAASSYQTTLDKSKIKNRLSLDYSSAIVNLEAQPIISIRFIIQGMVTGMPKPYIRFRSLNFDMDSGEVIALSDNFKPDSPYVGKIAAYVHKELAKELHDKLTLGDDQISIDQFNNWNINLNGIRISFDEAAVAPAAMGSQSVLIPYSAISSLINPDSALGRCLEHRKRCMRDHVLTGGFIDEAANTRDRRLNPLFG